MYFIERGVVVFSTIFPPFKTAKEAPKHIENQHIIMPSQEEINRWDSKKKCNVMRVKIEGQLI